MLNLGSPARFPGPVVAQVLLASVALAFGAAAAHAAPGSADPNGCIPDFHAVDPVDPDPDHGAISGTGSVNVDYGVDFGVDFTVPGTDGPDEIHWGSDPYGSDGSGAEFYD